MATLHMICGLPGAGKTTLARQLEVSLKAVRFSPDEWLRDLGMALGDAVARNRIEDLQWRVACRCLCAGTSVILENGFWSRQERDSYRNEAAEVGADVKIRALSVPIDELKRRIAARNLFLPPEEVIDPDDVDAWAELFEPPSADEL